MSDETNTITTDNNNSIDDNAVPIVDLSNPDKNAIINQIATACSTWGFFQVINHSIPPSLIESFRHQMALFFSHPSKKTLWRHDKNARGYFDNELTKQRRDWKECLDVGVPGSRDWNVRDDDVRNACLDGFNQFPPSEELPEFRDVVVRYFEECVVLADRIAVLMMQGLLLSNRGEGEGGDKEEKDDTVPHKSVLQSIREEHTSYLRMNHYPPYSPSSSSSSSSSSITTDTDPPPLGISPHRDAGFLTVLIQDTQCHSLQVAKPNSSNGNEEWVTVKPVPGSFTINTGDMAMIWSNGRYKAPLHRVVTHSEHERYSAPFFYNPGYETMVRPLRLSGGAWSLAASDEEVYHPCSWGYFRAVRFAGDLTDLGTEIQVSDYEWDSGSHHLRTQVQFLKDVNFHEPFSVEMYQELLMTPS